MKAFIGLASGVLFGAGLALSGMMNPSRVRSFLDVFGRWDPTLGFVMAGALAVMALAWMIQRRMEKPVAHDLFHLPGTARIDARLVAGSALFGIGWGIAGLCPGPAIASLAVNPAPAVIFSGAMVAGMALFHVLDRVAIGAAK